ncbi:hemicentin-1-like [Takifugu flavidus]|uniref:hemicentin-1-like n=1 Tax=Takifugu flavidus TaxID=433684 RepID=UPI0025441658|nr:hemicentin-1-like [Takifugu flavidus]
MSPETSCVLIFAALLLVATGGRALCPIELSPSSVVVRYGDKVAINCSALTNQHQGIGWESTQGGTGLTKVSHLTWTVDRLTDWSISPWCFIFHGTNQQCTSEPIIVLYTFPDSIHISSTAGSNRTMKESTAYNFICNVPNVAPIRMLTVSLYRGNTIIHTRTFNHPTKEAVNQSAAISFVPSREDSGVAFKCEAVLDLGPGGPKLSKISEPYEVTVHYGPVIRCVNEAFEWKPLGDLCNVTGNPPPRVLWRKDGNIINPAVQLSRKNAGTYVVEAEGASVISEEIDLAVLYKPELSCPSVYTVLEHMPHNLTCTVEGYPKPNITWYKDGEEVVLPEYLTRRDAGQYLVAAENMLGNVSATVDITVFYPPSQVAELEDMEVEVGSSGWLKCSSTGNPRPQYMWNYYQADNVMEENDDGVSRLMIDNATALNTGSYTCRAWNDRGNDSKTVRVHVKGAQQECPIEITPEKMVIPYQSKGQSVTCRPTTSGSRNIEGKVSWQLQDGNKTGSSELSVDPSKDWDLQPICTATFRGIGPCSKPFHFTLYKTPDHVSIRAVDHLSAVVENKQFQLQCNITGVAPARHLTVRWYQGNKTLQTVGKESLHVTGCPREHVSGCDMSVTRSPMNVFAIITLTLDRSDSGTTFWCEAQLDLGPAGPQPPPKMMSSPLNITVYYKPTINTTKLPKVIPVFRGYPEELICEADGHPPPNIQWSYSKEKVANVSQDTLLVTEAGYYNCSATNEVDSIVHVVEVILKEDYLPLIAGLVAITVIGISIVFVSIYSIYYKNTKMRRYNLKNAKLNTQTGNVAHNSWDSQFPMTKLS